MSIPTEASVRDEVRAWLVENWSPELGLAEWRRRLIESGWGCPSWPTAWFGRGLPPALAAAAEDEMRLAGAVGVAQFGVRMLVAATLLEHGTDEQKRRLLPRLLTGEDTWCQLFSEPGSGSDLAGVSTRAAEDAEGWTVTGQKVWTTSAQHAHYGILLARTDWDLPKHRGLSFFVLPMHQAGVEVRPLRQMNGYSSFNEVFISGAHIGREGLVGKLGEGWKVALTTLAHERRLADSMRNWGRLQLGAGRIYEELKTEHAAVMEPYKWYAQRAGRADLLIERAQRSGRIEDAVVRQDIARALMIERASEWTAARARRTRQRPAAGTGRFAGQARRQQRRPCGRASPCQHQWCGVDAGRRGWTGAGTDRRDPGFGARLLDCRRHRRDPAKHHRRARARPAQGARWRRRDAVPRRAPEFLRQPITRRDRCL